MTYLVLARKYRPETFRDVVGQESVSRTLQNSIRHGRIAHAFLFSGPRGVGKTSMARILSKALNCVKGPTLDPCLECDRCRAIAAGSAIDVIEIDAASNRGIDNIRSLRENVRYAPAGSRFKIYIVDEVHMLTPESFNALLKTLEEPPEHVKFIFATTEPQKLPETVRSRCQCYEFRRISAKDIAARLEFILKSEGVECEPGVLYRVASYARGGMRDAQSLLDQMIAFGGGRATLEGMSELTGSLSPEAVADLVDAVLDEKIDRILDLTGRFFQTGTRAEDLFRELVDHYRLLMTRLTGAGAVDAVLTGADDVRIDKQASRTDLDRVLLSLQIVLQAHRQCRFFDDDRVLAELTLVKLARLSSTIDLGRALGLIEGIGSTAGKAPSSEQRSRPSRQGPLPPHRGGGRDPGTLQQGGGGGTTRNSEAKRGGGGKRERGDMGTEGPLDDAKPPMATLPTDIPPERKDLLNGLFKAVIEEVEKVSKSTAYSLRTLIPLRMKKDLLYLADSDGPGKKLLGPDDPSVAEILRKAARRVTGRVLAFRVESQGGEPPGGIPPIVKKTRDMFEGDIV